jgi:glycosyltransferase involved in cell wall biosynthesis
MMIALLNSDELNQHHSATLSYRFSNAYESGLRRKIKTQMQIFPIRFFEPMRLGIEFSSDKKMMKLALGVIRKIVFYPVFFLQTIKLALLLLKIKPDILHINGGGYPAALSTRAAVLAGRISRVSSIIYFSNNLAVPYNSIQRLFEYPIDLIVRNSVDLFLTGSLSAKSELMEVIKAEEFRFKTINNGINPTVALEPSLGLNQKSVDDSKLLVGIVAVLEPRKGHLDLLESLRQLRDSGVIDSENFTLRIAGEGWLKGQIEQEIEHKGLANLVELVGEIENVYSFISELDILVLPSTNQEDFPNVILEAMAMSKPVIGTNVGGIPEQVMHGITGYLIAPRNPDELAESLSILIHDETLRVRMGKNGKKRFLEQFTSQLAIERYILEYALLKESKDVTK